MACVQIMHGNERRQVVSYIGSHKTDFLYRIDIGDYVLPR